MYQPRGLEVAVDLLAGALERLVEHVELELGGHVDLEAEIARPGDLALEDRARRMRHVMPVGVDHVAEHERGALEPGNPAQGREVGADREVTVAEIPGRRRVARHRLHVHVQRQ
jgi:hypothetical protein